MEEQKKPWLFDDSEQGMRSELVERIGRPVERGLAGIEPLSEGAGWVMKFLC